MHNLLGLVILDNTVSAYLIFLAIVLAGMAIVKIFALIVLNRFKEWSAKTATTIDNFVVSAVERSAVPLAYFYVFYLSLGYLSVPAGPRRGIEVLWVIVLTFAVLRLLVSVIEYSLENYWIKKQHNESQEKSLKGILAVIKVVIWGLGATFMLDNLGFQVSAVIAGLGIGGIAVALAAQAVLGDLFSYFAIFFDRPFEVGDFIIVGDFLGSVEHIGVKTTRLRSLGGEQIIFSNTDLTNSRLRNYKRMNRRRVVFKFGVVYQTPLARLKEIPELIAGIIRKNGEASFDRAHFQSYGDFSLVFEVVYYVESSDYNKFMDIQQSINLAINEEFAKRGIEFAFPTQTLYVNNEGNQPTRASSSLSTP